MNETKFQNGDLLKIYSIYELIYEEKAKKKFGDVMIFPNNWYRIINYNKKIDILKESIDNEILIINTKSYKNIIK